MNNRDTNNQDKLAAKNSSIVKVVMTAVLLFLILITSSNGQNLSCIKKPDAKYGRPTNLLKTYISHRGLFCLHFINSTQDSVPQVYTMNDTIPNFIILAGEYFEHSYEFIVDTLHLIPPPVDQSLNPEIDVYFSNIGQGYYGMTVAENDVPSTSQLHDYTAYIELHNNFEGTSFYTHGTEALKVTCAHELFHVFQLGYNLWDWTDDEIWFLESSSCWIEDAVFPDVNDYFQYVYSYSSAWGQPIMNYYNGSVSFNIFLESKFPGFTNEVWTNILEKNVFNSLDSFLKTKYQSNHWENAISEIGASHVYCSDQKFYSNSFFPDAKELPGIIYKTDHFLELNDFDTTSFILKGREFSNQFYSLSNINSNQLKVSLLNAKDVEVIVIVKDGIINYERKLGSTVEY
ncbi:MAG: hypothetical protein KAI81_04825, partial [Candidatus Marinimicrobia bacterium]|nr:hypothetical protein [Candidatus Neomarinimicrobiota bacterium]